tara:strand:+ start:124 stop:246 length:123 start_codon:yes stop_codon:yes gene_type:complete
MPATIAGRLKATWIAFYGTLAMADYTALCDVKLPLSSAMS